QGQGQGQGQNKPPAAKSAPAEKPGDEAAIHALNEAFAKAFDAGDAEAVAAQFTEDARVTDDEGESIDGRPAIRDRFAAGFADSPGRSVELKSESIRFITPDVAVEEGVATVTPPEGEGPPEVNPYTAIHVRRDGHWLTSTVRDHSLP